VAAPAVQVSTGMVDGLNFARPSGFGGSKPRNYIDGLFALCPMCGGGPEWEMAMKFQFKMEGNRYVFRCSQSDCHAAFSAPVPDVVGMGGGFRPIWMPRAKPTALRLEHIGKNLSYAGQLGQEIPIATLVANTPKGAKPADIYCQSCGTPSKADQQFCVACGNRL
jgi:hypothetical protein